MSFRKVRPLAVEESGHIYCQMACDDKADIIASFEDKCNQYAKMHACVDITRHKETLIKETVLAFWPEKGRFCRAQVMTIEDGEACVCFTDYNLVVDVKKIVVDIPEWIKNPSLKTVKAVLKDIEAIGGRWSAKAIDRIRKLIVDKVLDAEIKTNEGNDIVYMDMFIDLPGIGLRGVSGILVNEGFAQISQTQKANDFVIPQFSGNFERKAGSKRIVSPKAPEPSTDKMSDYEYALMLKRLGCEGNSEAIPPMAKPYNISETMQNIKQRELLAYESQGEMKRSKDSDGEYERIKKSLTLKPLTSHTIQSEAEFQKLLEQMKVKIKKILQGTNTNNFSSCLLDINEEMIRKCSSLIDMAKKLENRALVVPQIAETLTDCSFGWIFHKGTEQSHAVSLLNAMKQCYEKVKDAQDASFDDVLAMDLLKWEVKCMTITSGYMEKFVEFTTCICLAWPNSKIVCKSIWKILRKWSRWTITGEGSDSHVHAFSYAVSRCGLILHESLSMAELFDYDKLWPGMPQEEKLQHLCSIISLMFNSIGQVSGDKAKKQSSLLQSHVATQTTGPLCTADATMQTDVVHRTNVQLEEACCEAKVVGACKGHADNVPETMDEYSNVKAMLRALHLPELVKVFTKNGMRDATLKALNPVELKEALLESGLNIGQYFEVKNFIRNADWFIQDLTQASQSLESHNLDVPYGTKSLSSTSMLDRLFSPEYFETLTLNNQQKDEPAVITQSNVKDLHPQKPLVVKEELGAAMAPTGHCSAEDGIALLALGRDDKSISLAPSSESEWAKFKVKQKTMEEKMKSPGTPRQKQGVPLSASSVPERSLPMKVGRPWNEVVEPASALSNVWHQPSSSSINPALSAKTGGNPSPQHVAEEDQDQEISIWDKILDRRPPPRQVRKQQQETSAFALSSSEFPDLTGNAFSPSDNDTASGSSMETKDQPKHYHFYNPLVIDAVNGQKPLMGLRMCTNCGCRDHLVYNCPTKSL